jgi:hypothetical protein
VIDGTVNYPAYATVTPSGNQNFVWASSTQDPRALQKAASSAARIASCWYTQGSVGSSFTVDVNLTDGKTHNLAVYALDWDNLGARAETIAILNASTGAVLDSRGLSAFQGGQYLVWTVSGHVQIQVTNKASGGINAAISGLFFGQ